MKNKWKTDKKFRRAVLLAGMILILLFGTSFYTLFIKPNLSTDTYVYKEETVEKGDLVLGIMESGSIALGESSVLYELDLSTEEDSSDTDEEEDEDEEEDIRYLEVEEAYAVNGQRIKEGDPLFKFTDKSVEAVRRKLSAAAAEAQITFKEAETEYNISLLSAKSTYDTNKTTGNRATENFQAAITQSEESRNGLTAQIKVLTEEIEQAEKKLADEELLDSYEDAKTAYTQAKNRYEDTDLHNSTAYTSNLSDYEQAQNELESIENELQGYRDTITEHNVEIEKMNKKLTLLNSSQEAERQDAVNEYNSAKLSGELADEIYSYSTISLSDTVTRAEEDYKEYQEKLDAFESFVGEEFIIYAKEDGLVTNVAYSAGDDVINTGAMLTYAKEDEYTVSIDISEEDIAAIKLGDNVTLDVSAYPDTDYQGIIKNITTSAASDHASTVSYPVTIQIEGDTAKLYGGMTADVTFVTDSVTDVCYISKKAVFEENDISFVYFKNSSGKMEKKEVETGFSDGVSVEVTSGLSEGDVVYIQSKMNVEEENKSWDSTKMTETTDGSTDHSYSENGAGSGQQPGNGSDSSEGFNGQTENGFPEGGFKEQMEGGFQ